MYPVARRALFAGMTPDTVVDQPGASCPRRVDDRRFGGVGAQGWRSSRVDAWLDRKLLRRSVSQGSPARLTVATMLGWALLGLMVLAWVHTARVDVLSTAERPPSLTALSFAGSAESAGELLCRWAPGDPTSAVGALQEGLRRDRWLIAAYFMALTYWLLLGASFERSVSRRIASLRLTALMALAALADVVNSWSLGRWLGQAHRCPPPQAAGSAWLTTAAISAWIKWSVVLVALAFVGGFVADVTIRFYRLVVSDHATTPVFWSGKVPDVKLPYDASHAPQQTIATGWAVGRSGATGSSSRPHDRQLAQDQRFLGPDGYPWHTDEAVTGVAFSGGGIRAAAYCLGALQALIMARQQESPFLQRVRYLSTVSGGGYIGGGFQALAHLQQSQPVAPALLPFAETSPEYRRLAESPQYLWAPVLPKTLRSHPVSRQALGQAFVATRELLWTMLALVASIAFNIAVVLAVLYVVSRGAGFAAHTFLLTGDNGPGMLPTDWYGALAAAIVLAFAFHRSADYWVSGWLRQRRVDRRGLTVLGTILAAGAFVLPVILVGLRVSPWWLAVLALGSLVAFLVAALGQMVEGWRATVRPRGAGATASVLSKCVSFAYRYGPGGALLAGAGALALHWFAETEAGSWSRPASLGSVVRWVATLTTATVTAIAAFAVVRSVISVLIARRAVRAAPQDMSGSEARPLTVEVRRPRLVVGVGGLVVVAAGLAGGAAAHHLDRSVGSRMGQLSNGWAWLITSFALLAVYAVADQKAWSPHPFYKRRLAGTFELYRPSEQHPAESVPYRVPTTLSEWGARVPGLPEHLICAAVYDSFQNVEDNGGLAAHPFVFSGRYVGSGDIGWMRTVDFEAALGGRNAGDGTLFGAVAVSGAAVSPGIGRVDLGTLGAFLALFNGRLGVWLPSPRYVAELFAPARSLEGARPMWVRTRRLNYLLRELTGRYDPEDRFVYVTDGGQFDNLGLYALLQRRCRTIIAFDASGDLKPAASGAAPDCTTFVEVRNYAMKRLGVTMVSDDGPAEGVGPVGRPLRPAIASPHGGTRAGTGGAGRDAEPNRRRREMPRAEYPVSRFTIKYPAVAGEPPTTGRLYLVKAVISEISGCELCRYADDDVTRRFPGDSTLDQFMSPERFGMYVRLGKENAQTALANVLNDDCDPGDPRPAGPRTKAPGETAAPHRDWPDGKPGHPLARR